MANNLQIRPRFYLTTRLAPQEVLGRLQAHISQKEPICSGMISFQHAMLRMPEDATHFWSPRLTIQVEQIPEGSLLRCLFGPSPTVWTFFIAVYVAVGFLGAVALMWGLSQLSLGMNANILWLVPVSIVAGFTAWLVAGYGQHLGQEQMLTLREFMTTALGDCKEIEERELADLKSG